MSIESCIAFFQELTAADELKQQMKATTDTKELIVIGKRYGYTFDANDLVEASNSFRGGATARKTDAPASRAVHDTTAFYHYEFDMEQIPGFEEINRELDNLKVKPSTVDLDLYEKSFRQDDLQFTSLSPAAPEFMQYYEEVMRPRRRDVSNQAGHDFSRRDFHLINLDQHVEYPLYEQYFQAKTRMISHLEAFFGAEVQFSGSMWYPPSAYRLWHTNETQPGWRMYLIDFDEPGGSSGGASFFRYMNPQNQEIVTLAERPKLVRFFKIEQEKDKLFWHCIVNATTRNRWSFGFAVPENWLEKFPRQS